MRIRVDAILEGLNKIKDVVVDDENFVEEDYEEFLDLLDYSIDEKGNRNSGNWGHEGRPGKIGGSLPKDEGDSQKDLKLMSNYHSGKDGDIKYNVRVDGKKMSVKQLKNKYLEDSARGKTKAKDFREYFKQNVKANRSWKVVDQKGNTWEKNARVIRKTEK
jgi:hypothetical protein